MALRQRGCELLLPPLHIELPERAAVSFKLGFDPAALRRIKEFAADLWEAGVLAPLI